MTPTSDLIDKEPTMRHQRMTGLALAAATLLLGTFAAFAADKPAVDRAAVNKAFETLKTYDWGTDRGTLKAIDDAVIATHGNAAARKDLEKRLAAVLMTGASRAAKDFACRKLTVIGTAESVPALAGLLTDKDQSHMARYALERIPAPEAAQALREALPRVSGAPKAGVIGSLGVRRDAASVDALASSLHDTDKVVACAAACSLGNIGTPEAGKILSAFAAKAPEDVKTAAVDACLVCAERLLADGKKVDAAALYKLLAGPQHPKHVRLAAARGLLAVAGKKER
jgi:HEAT repeat protein